MIGDTDEIFFLLSRVLGNILINQADTSAILVEQVGAEISWGYTRSSRADAVV